MLRIYFETFICCCLSLWIMGSRQALQRDIVETNNHLIQPRCILSFCGKRTATTCGVVCGRWHRYWSSAFNSKHDAKITKCLYLHRQLPLSYQKINQWCNSIHRNTVVSSDYWVSETGFENLCNPFLYHIVPCFYSESSAMFVQSEESKQCIATTDAIRLWKSTKCS